MGRGRVVDLYEWNSLKTPDIYYSEAYNSTSALIEPDRSETLLLEWSDDNGTIRLPLILRQIPGHNYFDATSAYGYGGPWIEGNPNLFSFRAFIYEWAHDRGVVASFLRFHPLMENAEQLKAVLPLKSLGQTAVWNVSKASELVPGMAKNHRKNWRRAVRAGVEARVTFNPDSSDEFRKLYETSMRRLSANDFYWFSGNYWKSLVERLGENSLLVEAVYQEEVVAAAWCLVSDNFLHFHLSGTSEQGRKLGGSYICRVAAAEWALENRISMLHHGGGAGAEESSLLKWKQNFDPSTPLLNYHVAELVHDEEKYHDISREYSESTYFPPWRHPGGKLLKVE